MTTQQPNNHDQEPDRIPITTRVAIAVTCRVCGVLHEVEIRPGICRTSDLFVLPHGVPTRLYDPIRREMEERGWSMSVAPLCPVCRWKGPNAA